MKFCSQCGAPVSARVPEGDTRHRHVCDSCDTIHYQNPNIVAGCIPEWEDRILLCRRAIEPRRGLWTLPAGFMENDETTLDAAKRETYEEANAKVEVLSLYTLFNLPHINQVYVIFRGKLIDTSYSPGSESLEVELYQEQDIPWGKLAFPVVQETLKLYYQDKARGSFVVHTGDIIRLPGEEPAYRANML